MAYPSTHNPRIAQALRHAGVRVVAISPDRVVLVNTVPGAADPLERLVTHLEPSASRGHEHMPSLDEARALGLIED